MTDQLRDLLTRRADDAVPAPVDPTLWARARRAKRRTETLTACAAGLAVFALVAAAGVLVRTDQERSDPSQPTEPGIPSRVLGVDGDGGLPLETDLSIGTASVAIANPTDAFVVTADDGGYHRLALPGFDAAAYDVDEVRRTGMVGVSLSPDGTRLAYGWHAALPEETGQEHGYIRSGLRILDLRNGQVETVTDNGPTPLEFDFTTRNDQSLPAWVVVPYGLRWSADSRFVTYDSVWAPASPDVGDAYENARSSSSASVYDIASGERFSVNGPSSYVHGLGWTGWPQMVSRSGLVATASGGLVFAERETQRRVRDLPDGDRAQWVSGLFASAGRVVVEPAVPDDALLAVTLRTGAVERLRLDTDPARVDLLGWVGREQALALVHRGTGDSEWEQDADLVVLDLSDADVESTTVGRVETEGTDSTFAFATGYATVKDPTQDFESSDGADGGSTAGDAPLPATDAETGPDRTWLAAGLAGGLAAGVVALVVLRRRIRPR